ncbi:hypothetical protein RUM43_003842 [Polyplax serrata]|uniref:GST C-terminal domain-containing protein n=1 Tax=Polyplax serrata TaxID=468196 RepID=A0AAN8Q739_POLSC
MKELYLETFTDIEEDGTCCVPIETVISLFTLAFCDHPPILLTFVITEKRKSQAGLKVRMTKLVFEVIEAKEMDGIAGNCMLPVIVTCDGTTAVAGLCAVLRQVVKVVDQLHPLLGFKQSCLYACAESSLWTKFCEVDVIKMVNDVYLRCNLKCDNVEIPEEMARFEVHMSQPVRIHNIQKQKQDLAKKKGTERKSRLPDNRLDLVLELEHVFAEGPNMTLADVMLFPAFYVTFENLGSVFLKQNLPLSYRWYETMLRSMRTQDALKKLVEVEKKFDKEIYVKYVVPQVVQQSLYKGEMKKRQPKKHLYTRQEDIIGCFEMIDTPETKIEVMSPTFGHEIDFDWSTIPPDFRLDDSQVPVKRLDRKGQQLQNMTKAVLKIARTGDIIVDFCSGSGHLGLILAYVLPRCSVILLENKEQSLNRARDRATKLKLSNVIFCQSNVDYFKGHFDIGVSLHACGVATDLVMERCIRENATFVCCPCCYGSIQTNHIISYPRSQAFRNTRLTLQEYFVLGHSSDQTHDETNMKTSQGNRCMIAIDTDRCLRAEEAGYMVFLSKLDPPSCTPKNNLLVGVPAERKTNLNSVP